MEHGIARYYLRLISHGLGGGNPLGDMAMRRIERRAKKKDYYGTYLYPISEMLKDEEIPKIQEEIRNAWNGDIPPDDLEKAVNIVPDIIKVAKILGDVIDKHHKVNKKGLTAYHAFIDFINHPTPARLVKTLADNPQEALEAIYKLHVKLYHLLPEFFEKESGIEQITLAGALSLSSSIPRLVKWPIKSLMLYFSPSYSSMAFLSSSAPGRFSFRALNSSGSSSKIPPEEGQKASAPPSLGSSKRIGMHIFGTLCLNLSHTLHHRNAVA